MQGQDLTKGSIRKELWSLAWPLMLSVFFYTLYNIVDAFWVSKLSAEAIAAVSIAQITQVIMVSLSMGITVGSGVIMAMCIGAKDIKEAERVLGQSFVLAAIVGVIFTIISIMFRNELLAISGASGRIVAPALEYFTITSAGSIFLFLMMTVMFAFNSQGDTFTLTKLFALSTFVNVILDPLMIFGWKNIPAYGIAGAAYATLISQAVFLVAALYTLSRPHRGIRFRFSNLSFRWESVKKVLNIGIPASLTQVIGPVGLAALMYITALGFHESGTIAFSLGFRVEFFAFLPAIGFGFGSMAMIGQSIGAGNKARAQEIFNKALKYGFFAAVGMGLLAIIFARFIIGIFTSDPEVTAYALSYLWIVALSYGFIAASMVESSTFQAMGRSWPGFWIFVIRFAVVSIPLSYVLTRVFELPITAIWISLVVGNILSSAVGYVWLKKSMNRINLSAVPVHASQMSETQG